MRIDKAEVFPVRHADARPRRSRWHPVVWLVLLLTLALGACLATYGLVAPYDPLSGAQEPWTTEQRAANGSKDPVLNGFKDFRLGMTRAEVQEVVQEWGQEWGIESNWVLGGDMASYVHPPDRPGYRGIKDFYFIFDAGRLVKMGISFTHMDFQSEEGKKFFDALKKKYGRPKTATVSFHGAAFSWVWESRENDLRLEAVMAPAQMGSVSLCFEHGVISREQAEQEALRQRKNDAIESLRD